MNDPRDPNDTDYDPYFDETFDEYGYEAEFENMYGDDEEVDTED